MATLVLGVFSDRVDAETAIDDLEQEGYSPKDMSIIMKDKSEGQQIASNTGANVAGGAATGATTGALIGGVAGLLVGAGAIAIPGLGALLIGGPLAAAFGLTGAAATTVSGAAAGALAGGVLGALMGLGIPREEAAAYETRINEGAILLAIPTTGNEDIAEEILSDNNATDIRRITVPTDRFATPLRKDLLRDDYTDEYVDVPPQDMTGQNYAVGYKGGETTGEKPVTRRTRRRIRE